MFVAAAIDAISSIIKLNEHDPRPFWVSDDIQAFSCSNQYGNPSGHCFTCLGIPLAAWLDYNSTAMMNPEAKWSAWYLRLIAFIPVLLFPATIAYSRMFLGVHSLNQVLYGLSLGAWFAFSSEFLIRKHMVKLIQDLIDVQEKRLLRLFLVSFTLFVAASSLQIINYKVANEFDNLKLWKTEITKKCGAEELKDAF